MMDKQKMRVLRFLAAGGAKLSAVADGDRALLDGGDRGTIAVEPVALRELASDGLVSAARDHIALTDAGKAFRRRFAGGADGFLAQHRKLELQDFPDGAGREQLSVNLDESPLSAIARRKGRDGRQFLTGSEVAAGERLRADYTRGQIMPRLGANWQASVASGRRDGGRGGVADLTDAALAARIRVEQAIEAVGPELAGVLIDICCYLKGLETVERERGWPVRSAKVVLKTGLGALARHYEPQKRRHAAAGDILHWGAEGYRPNLGG
jgi:hypothetical protein